MAEILNMPEENQAETFNLSENNQDFFNDKESLEKQSQSHIEIKDRQPKSSEEIYDTLVAKYKAKECPIWSAGTIHSTKGIQAESILKYGFGKKRGDTHWPGSGAGFMRSSDMAGYLLEKQYQTDRLNKGGKYLFYGDYTTANFSMSLSISREKKPYFNSLENNDPEYQKKNDRFLKREKAEWLENNYLSVEGAWNGGREVECGIIYVPTIPFFEHRTIGSIIDEAIEYWQNLKVKNEEISKEQDEISSRNIEKIREFAATIDKTKNSLDWIAETFKKYDTPLYTNRGERIN